MLVLVGCGVNPAGPSATTTCTPVATPTPAPTTYFTTYNYKIDHYLNDHTIDVPVPKYKYDIVVSVNGHRLSTVNPIIATLPGICFWFSYDVILQQLTLHSEGWGGGSAVNSNIVLQIAIYW